MQWRRAGTKMDKRMNECVKEQIGLLCGKAKIELHCTSHSIFLELSAREQSDVEKYAENNHFRQF